MSLLPEINQASAEINKFVAQANIHQTIAPVNPAEFTSPADTLLLASRDPVIREVSVGMTGVEAVQNTVSGTPPLSLPNSLGKPLKAWEVDVVPYQEGTGDPAPDNVRPIHGTDKLTITTAGKNLLNKTDFVVETANTTVTTTDTGIKILVTGIGTYRRAINVNVIDYASAAGKTVTLSYHNTNLNGGIARYRIALYKQDGTQKQALVENAQTTDRDITTTVAVPSNVSEAYSLGITLYANGNDANDASVEYSNLQLEFGSNASDYVPYVAPSQTVLTLPQTVYTGTIGSEGGESRTAMVTLDGNTPANVFSVTVLQNYTQVSYMPYISVGTAGHNLICSTLKSGTSDGLYRIWGSSVPRLFMGLPTSVTNAAGAVAWFADNPTQIVYPLATPTTFAPTTPTIPTPTGSATTWATAEDGTVDSMSVTYVGKA